MKNSKTFMFVAIISILLITSQRVESIEAEFDQLKAAFILRFITFTEWPDNSPVMDSKTPFVIAIYGETPVFSILQDTSKKYLTINNKKVKVISVSEKNLPDLKTSQLVFISNSSSKTVKKVIQEISNLSILTVGDSYNYENLGVMINLFPNGDNCGFNINLVAVEKGGLKISSKVMMRAKKIIK